MPGQPPVDHLAWRDEKILSPHAVLQDSKRRATGGCQLREREGHHPLREEQHDCLRLPGLHGDQPSTSRRKEELKALRRSLATQRSRFRTGICVTSAEDRKYLTYALLSVLYYIINTKYRRSKEAGASGEAVSNEGKCL